MVDSTILRDQFEALKEKYPGLELIQDTSGLWCIQGELHFLANYEDQEIEDKYSIELIIPGDYPDSYPEVREIENKIPKDFHQSGYLLCLGAPIAVLRKFREANSTLLGFTETCLIPYLYGFSYKLKYGSMPYGELRHGLPGILQYYQEYFGVDNAMAVRGLLGILAGDRYRGHIQCPCGSGNKLRRCHGDVIRNLSSQVHSRKIFKNDFDSLF